MFLAGEIAEIAAIAREYDLEPAALLAVGEVESGGITATMIKGRAEPSIRFEGHYFYRLLPALKRNRAVAAGLAHPQSGKIANPRSQTARWKLLNRAFAIDRPAALEATSWGMGQVMGAHWRWLDYASIDALAVEARSGVSGQVRLMTRFIAKAGLREKLNGNDWAGFARAYNGPGYRANKYDEKLEAAYFRLGGIGSGSGRHDLAMLRAGAKGRAVEDMQRWLRILGHPLIADGDFGPATEAALQAFQAQSGLTADGAFGPRTIEAMYRRLPKEIQTG